MKVPLIHEHVMREFPYYEQLTLQAASHRILYGVQFRDKVD